MSARKEVIVRLMTVDKRYRTVPYPSVPVKDERINTFLTGQHIDPAKPETLGNLTLAEMTGEKPLSPEKAAKFPFVIYPEVKLPTGRMQVNSFPLTHGDKLNLTRDDNGNYLIPRDKAMYDYWLLQEVIASSKDRVSPGRHYFYIENLLAEAAVRVEKADLQFEAESLIRNSNIGHWRDIALLLNHNVKNFNLVVDVLTELQIKDKLILAARDNPQAIIDCFALGVESDIFILKLKERGIIEFRNGAFYDGKLYLGSTLEQVKAFMSVTGNSDTVTKWSKLLS